MTGDITILGIESSCDETSAAVVKNGIVFSNIVASQDIHRSFGGVVPELASRAHQANIVWVVEKALKDASIDQSDLNAIAYTRGPGLLGALLVGTSFAKAYALAKSLPVIDVHHMHAHIHALFIPRSGHKIPTFPFLCLTVSGGHTQLVVVENFFQLKVIGETKDDAAGEAFDKIGKLLGLDYPAGPEIDKRAKNGDPQKFKFPVPLVPDLDFSFSGLKTSVLYFLKKQLQSDPDFIKNHLDDLCASVQFTIVKILSEKSLLALKQTHISQLALAGGVSANSGLRSHLYELGKKNKFEVFISSPEYCTDNAAMIAMSGYFRYRENKFGSQTDAANANMNF